MKSIVICRTQKDRYIIGSSTAIDEYRTGFATQVPLTLIDEIETDQDTVAETFLHRQFSSYLCPTDESMPCYQMSEAVVKEGVSEVKRFLHECRNDQERAQEYAKVEPTTAHQEPTLAVKEIHQQLLTIKSQINRLREEAECLENKLKCTIGNASGIEGVATWKLQSRTKLDQKLLKDEHPDLYEKYTSKQPIRVLLLKNPSKKSPQKYTS
jgi:hypothetical protein